MKSFAVKCIVAVSFLFLSLGVLLGEQKVRVVQTEDCRLNSGSYTVQSSYVSPIYSVGASNITSSDAYHEVQEERSESFEDGLLGGSVRPPDGGDQDPASPIGDPYFLVVCAISLMGYKYIRSRLRRQ